MARPVARPARPAALPQWIQPQLTQLVDTAPEGDQRLHEIKFDGYRMHARLDRGVVKLLTRTGLDWTHKYPPTAEAVSSLGARQAYLDGELCGVFPDGITTGGGTPAETRRIISWIFAAHQMGGALAGIGAGAVRYLLAFMTSGLACLLAPLLVLRIRGLAPAIVPAV
jgi:hypothetical protein